MSRGNVGIHQEINKSQQQAPQLFYIFSKRNFFIFKNKKLKYFKKYFKEKNAKKVELIILEKSNRNFKYYETILLGMLIDTIESSLIKSNNYS